MTQATCPTCQEWSTQSDSLSRDLALALGRERGLREALNDMLSGWRYIRDTHGDLYGVGWNRAEDKARAALADREGK